MTLCSLWFSFVVSLPFFRHRYNDKIWIFLFLPRLALHSPLITQSFLLQRSRWSLVEMWKIIGKVFKAKILHFSFHKTFVLFITSTVCCLTVFFFLPCIVSPLIISRMTFPRYISLTFFLAGVLQDQRSLSFTIRKNVTIFGWWTQIKVASNFYTRVMKFTSLVFG